MEGGARKRRPFGRLFHETHVSRAAYRGGLTSWRRPFGPVSGVAARTGGPSTNRYQYISAASTPPTIGAKMYRSGVFHSPDTSAGPNQRAGFRDPPVSGPRIMTANPSVPPIASPDQSRAARG